MHESGRQNAAVLRFSDKSSLGRNLRLECDSFYSRRNPNDSKLVFINGNTPIVCGLYLAFYYCNTMAKRFPVDMILTGGQGKGDRKIRLSILKDLEAQSFFVKSILNMYTNMKKKGKTWLVLPQCVTS